MTSAFRREEVRTGETAYVTNAFGTGIADVARKASRRGRGETRASITNVKQLDFAPVDSDVSQVMVKP
jgi:hypothetical protein